MTTSVDQTARRQFQTLLRELFQFDSADLDFGIYRIMNHKREVVDDFIVNTLPANIDAALNQGPLVGQTQAEARLETAARRVHETLAEYAIDASGELDAQFHNTRAGQDYLTAQADAASGRSRAALETEIYNGLYTFFRRYYQDGDFIAQRRYSSHGHSYAIPYNGQEVYLHWANRDQYYVKTAEHFLNYDWKAANGVKVQFRLQDANVEQNNVKGDKRFFLPQADQMQWDADQGVLKIPMEYRPLTPAETDQYGKQKQQENILKAAATAIPAALSNNPEPLAALTAPHRHTAKGEPVTNLETHLRRYAARNNADFFINKDLAGFLNRELDFYLKSETLNLDHLLTAGPEPAAADFQKSRLMRQIGRQIIDFIGQLEGFQKSLWEKRKFVTQTAYCITLNAINPSFYPEIAANAAQGQEWRNLGFVDESVSPTPDFLRENPTLPLDTRHFDRDFTDRLLASFPDLDAQTDGILIHGDNWQALRLLEETYQGRVQCIYIDPPYNRDASEIIYKNGFKQSSWLTLMTSRIDMAQPMLNEKASWVIAIDDAEMAGLAQAIDSCLSVYDRNMVVVNHHPAGSGLEGTNVSRTHEYAIFLTPAGVKVLGGEKKTAGVAEIGFVRTGTADSNLRVGRPNSFYAVLVNPDTSEVVGAEPPPIGANYPRDKTAEGFVRIYPVSDDGTERVWRRSYKTIMSCIQRGEIVCKNSRSLYLATDQTGNRRPLFSNWTEKKYNAGAHGSNLIKAMFGDTSVFSYPKSIYTVRDCVDYCIPDLDDAIVLDYFAGSGTTGHAVINLNREDENLGGEDDARRRFILVEQGEYFDTVLLPRIKKATYAPEWAAGKPKRRATAAAAERSPRIVKYLRLESYEDALDSIEFDDHAGKLALEQLGPEYLLKYMLSWEAKASATNLNTVALDRPFDYQLQVRERGEIVRREVDLPETFNWLLGLRVQSRRVYQRDGRRYQVHQGETRSEPGQKTVVIWRETAGWTEADYAADRDFIAGLPEVVAAAAVYLNGDSALNRADCRAIEPVFKARMFAGVEEP